MKVNTFSTYSHYATAFLYDDTSGFTEEDEKEFREIMNELKKDYPGMYSITIADFGQDPYFTHYPDYGALAGTCLDYSVLSN